MIGVEVRQARESDRSGIVKLLASTLGQDHAEDVKRLWDWRWRDDPRLTEPGYYGHVGVWRDRIIATVSWLNAGFCRYGVPFEACWAIDAALDFSMLREVLRDARDRRKGKPRGGGARGSRSIMEDLLTHRDGPRVQVGKNVTERMLIVVRRVTYEPCPGSGYLMRNLSATPRVRRATGGLLAPLVAFVPNRLTARFPGGLGGATMHEGEFDESFDDLWEEVGAEYPNIARRDARTLNWRYRCHPFHTYTTVVYREGGRLRGYAVVMVLAKRDRPRGRIIDLLTRPGDEDTSVRLVTGALRELLLRGVARVDCYIGGEEQAGCFERLGFKRRSTSTPLTVRGELEGPLYLLAGDGDGS